MTNQPADVHAANAVAWNQTREWYQRHIDEALPGLRAGGTTLHPVELRLLRAGGDLSDWCEHAVHLQCAAGLDTMSLSNLGAARVSGLDIAEDLIELATAMATAMDRADRATFYATDVLTPPSALIGTADLVFTGKGAVHWMFDLRAWASVVHDLLAPGGVFLLYDFHPMMWLFRSDQPEPRPSGVSYFAPRISYRDWPDGHVGDLGIAEEDLAVKQLRPWPPSAVIQSLLDSGLELTSFGEYPDTVNDAWTAFPHWESSDRAKVASTYSILARKP